MQTGEKKRLRASLQIKRGMGILLIGLLFLSSVTQAEMTIHVDSETQRYTFEDAGKPVLTYNFGTVPVPNSVSGKYAVARSNYIHPLYGPSGEILTTDYSPNHPHHRGIYWAWPEVTYRDETRDLHALQGVFARPVRIVRQTVEREWAELEVENEWRWGDTERIVQERMTMRVGRENKGLRPLDFHLRLIALTNSVTIARRGKTSYGGFNLRFSEHSGQRIEHALATSGFPWPQTWGELSGVPPQGKEEIGAFIMPSPYHSMQPCDWIAFPNLNWLQPAFPAQKSAYMLEPKRPLDLRYRLVIRSGAGLIVPPTTMCANYAATLSHPLDEQMTWTEDQDRSTLTEIEQRLRTATPLERKAFELQLLSRLADPRASGPFRRWACRQLVMAGTDASVPVVAKLLLSDNDAWMQAADVLFSRPGDAGLKALRAALPSLSVARQSLVCHLLGMCHDARALPLLANFVKQGHLDVARTALKALADIGTPETAETLANVRVADALYPAWAEAVLQMADTFATHRELKQATTLYQLILNDARTSPWLRGAVLRGAVESNSAGARPLLIAALADQNAHLRRGAIAAFDTLDAATLAEFRHVYTNSTVDVQRALLSVWAKKHIIETEPIAIIALTSEDIDLQRGARELLCVVSTVQAVEPLLSHAFLSDLNRKEVIALLAMRPGEAMASALRLAAKSDNTRKAVVALTVLGIRRDAGYLDCMLAAVETGRIELMKVALTVLRNDGTQTQLSVLRQLLLKVPDSEKTEVASAMVAICKRQPNVETALSHLLTETVPITGTARNALVTALPMLGGETALNFVIETQDEVAARALLNWPDAAAIKPLMKYIQNATIEAPLRGQAAMFLVALVKRVVPKEEQEPILRQVLPYLSKQADSEALIAYLKSLLASKKE